MCEFACDVGLPDSHCHITRLPWNIGGVPLRCEICHLREICSTLFDLHSEFIRVSKAIIFVRSVSTKQAKNCIDVACFRKLSTKCGATLGRLDVDLRLTRSQSSYF